TSIRVFPTDHNADGIEVFSTSSAKIIDLNAWKLDVNASSAGIDNLWSNKINDTNKNVDVYNLQGVILRSNVPIDSATNDLPDGIYIVNGEKIIVR
ncbi:MAG: hypothetical protein K2L31_06265, partial [Muribaculum sp.]|nr:hypothetical protein [Muribaculum sp.]